MKLIKLCVEQKMSAKDIVKFFKSHNINFKGHPTTEIPDSYVRLLRRNNKQIQVTEKIENKKVTPNRAKGKNISTDDKIKKPTKVSIDKDISTVLSEKADSESVNYRLVYTSTSPKANVKQPIKPKRKISKLGGIHKKRMLKFKAKLAKKKTKSKRKSATSKKGGGVSKIYGSIIKLTPIFKKR